MHKNKNTLLKRIKPYIVIAFSFLVFGHLSAQKYSNNARVLNLERYDKNPYHFGFALGLNQMDFRMKRTEDYRLIDTLYAVNTVAQPGFNIGIVSNLRLTDYLDLRFIPSLLFGERVLQYKYLNRALLYDEEKRIESNILSFPLLIKYKADRITNTRVYVIGGISYTLDLASQSKKKELFEEVQAVKIFRNDFMYEVGAGFDFYLIYFKLALELKYATGHRNLLKQENTLYTTTIDKLNSQMFIFSVTFE